MARITIIGADGQQDRELLPHNTLGRHPNNTHQVLDRIVSKEHCHIDAVEGGYVLHDLGSLNGTFVNGARVGDHPLRDGDEIMMGSTRIIFRADEVARPEHTSSPPQRSATIEQQGFGATNPQVASPDFHRPAAAPSGGIVNAAAAAAALAAAAAAPRRRQASVTMAPGMVESHIRTKLDAVLEQSFVPAHMVSDPEVLRRDYEKLRVSYEMMRAIGVELDVDKLLTKILAAAFQILPADRGVILLYDDHKQLTPRCVQTKRQQAEGENVVLSTTIIDQVLRDKAAVLSSDASVDSRFSGAHSIIMQGIRSSMAVPLLHAGEVFGIMLLDSQIAANAFNEKDLQLFQNVANQAAIAIQNSLFALRLEAEAVTRERFQRLLSPAIAEQVLSGKVEVKKYGEARPTTVLFSDIRGFTSMSESIPAREMVDMLNEYFELMVDIIFKYQGTLDKFVGDEIMALYGAPVSYGDDAVRAVRTALEMYQVLDQLNERRAVEGKSPIKIGIGINTGEVVAGYLGSSKALEYTVIGDSVNVGARLCSHAGAGECLISEWTYNEVKDYFEFDPPREIQAKGKAKPLQVYNVLRAKPQQGWDDRTASS
jgi:adenylate cyclase